MSPSDRPSVHEKKIRDLFKGRCQFTGAERQSETLLLIAFTNRCGSTYLAELLRGTGLFSGLHEHLNWDVVTNLSKENAASSFPEYVQKLDLELRGDLDFFGFKASCDQLLMLLRFGVEKAYRNLKVIHIERGDVVAQAVSFSIADQTKRWNSRQSGNGTIPVYNERDIHKRVQGTNAGNNCIRSTTSAFELDVHHVMYEDLVKDPKLVLRRICSWLEVSFEDSRPLADGLKRQSDAYNLMFSERYRAARKAALLGN